MDFLKGKRILIAEDDFVNQRLITHSLNSTRVAFDIAGNGEEAVELVKSAQYDLVLMDINMPVMDGFEATRKIRRDIGSNIPIIAMTGWSSRTEKDKFIKEGMNGCLSKPFGLEALFSTLSEIFVKEQEPVTAALAQTDTTVDEPVDEAPLIDLDLLNELSVGDQEYKNTIIQMFLESMPENIQKMTDYFAEHDLENLYKSAHYAKSSLTVVKVPEMHKLAHAVEINARLGRNLETIEPTLNLIKKNFELVREALLKEIQPIA